jgi:hypothetical protein
MPLLAELPALDCRSYEDFAPTELVILGARRLTDCLAFFPQFAKEIGLAGESRYTVSPVTIRLALSSG